MAVGLFAGSCVNREPAGATLILATTTSTRDSGLLDLLVPRFEQQTGIAVKVIAVGTGQALELGRRGDVDALLTHAPPAEQRFMAAGHGARRQAVMANDFVLVGPANDPADVQSVQSIAVAFQRIARTRSAFVSRGDESGTHLKEREVWRQASIKPQAEWYIESGAGMAHALRIANETEAYTLTDRGTYLAHRDALQLQIVYQGDSLLRNPYAFIVVSSKKHPGRQQAAAERFLEFLISSEVQQMIGQFGRRRFGQRLFIPQTTMEP